MGIFGGGKVFNPAKDIPDLSGKVALVTGGNAGIGAAFVRALAAHNPACIYLCARTQTSAEAITAAVKLTHPKTTISILPLDLSTFDSVRKCAQEFNSKASRLDYLFLNAGISATAPVLTRENYESQFGINHMGHALFTQLILPKMLQTKKQYDADVRIMLTSSIASRQMAPSDGLHLQQMKTPAAEIKPLARYGHSKLANVLFARSLAEYYPSITTTSHHPGTVKSEIWGKATGMPGWLSYVFGPVVAVIGIGTDEGAETGLWTAFEKVENGGYYEPVGKKVEVGSGKMAEELWVWTDGELKGHGGEGWPAA